jgi:hypothetical protein
MLFLLQAIPTLTRQPYWYEIVAGILAIPFVSISIALSYLLIKKTRIEQKKLELESRKFALEIKEKEGIQDAPPETTRVIENLAEPLAESHHVQLIILRFILLFLVIRGWAIIEFGASLEQPDAA